MTQPHRSPATSAPVRFEVSDDIAQIVLSRPKKRNALSDEMVASIGDFCETLHGDVRSVILSAEGDHFSAGLDLSALSKTDTFGGLLHSRSWHRAFAKLEQGSVPVIAVLKGAVIGGGLELAGAAHIRIAEPSAFYALPEGSRGLFVGGGGSVRIPRLIGTSRMADMMLTGRVLTAEEGHQFGISNYLVEPGHGLAKAKELAAVVSNNTPVTNFAIINALPRIAQANPEDGFMMESMIAAIAQGTDEANERMQSFLAGRASKVKAAGVSTDGTASQPETATETATETGTDQNG